MRRALLLTTAITMFAVVPTLAQPVYRPGPDEADMLVTGWYEHFLARPPDAGAAGWAAAVRAAMARGQGPETVLAQILGSPEYYSYGNSTPLGFVQRLFYTLIGRWPTPAEARAWVGRLAYRDRADVAYEFLLRYPQHWRATPQSIERDRRDREYHYRRPSRYWHPPAHHDYPGSPYR
jgi:hypothetical protein